MTDMLVNLYQIEDIKSKQIIDNKDIKFKRALAIDSQIICDFVAEHFTEICPGWVDETRAALSRHPSCCYIATDNGKVIGFTCYDGTAKAMVGPVGVDPAYRKQGVATALLHHCFDAMIMDGYAYAIIGWVSSTEFYEKTCGAIAIPDSFPGVYSRMVMEHP